MWITLQIVFQVGMRCVEEKMKSNVSFTLRLIEKTPTLASDSDIWQSSFSMSKTRSKAHVMQKISQWFSEENAGTW